MRKIIFILVLLAGVSAAAQNVRVTDFRQIASGMSDPRERATRADADGEMCAVIHIITDQEGWTFDAGLAGIIDTRQGKGVIYLYIPSCARTLSFSHYRYGSLRNWAIPVSLAPGGTYELKLKADLMPEHKPAVTTRPSEPRLMADTQKPQARPVAPKEIPTASYQKKKVVDRSFCSHFIDGCCGFGSDEIYLGLRYSYMGSKVGPYLSAAFSTEGAFSAFAGAGVHLLPERKAHIDLQAYAGLGIADGGKFAGELGIVFAWKTRHEVSCWDFGFGVQMWDGRVMPTVSVGLCLWGIPVAVGLCLCGAAL